jgi:hypothetical protein
MTPEQLKTASISQIARAIQNDCGDKMPRGASPYVQAMLTMEKASDSFGLDDGESIINYALCNLQSWRGQTARDCKAELKRRVK